MHIQIDIQDQVIYGSGDRILVRCLINRSAGDTITGSERKVAREQAINLLNSALNSLVVKEQSEPE